MIDPCEVPAGTLLTRYQGGGAYADCFTTEVDQPVSHAAFVEAFYTSAVFRVERALLRWPGGFPANDQDAKQLASGAQDHFSAWHVEARAVDQLLVRFGNTSSWLMVAPGDTPPRTRLYFGSAVVGRTDARTGVTKMGTGFHALLGFHQFYSRVLLASARRKLGSESNFPRAGG